MQIYTWTHASLCNEEVQAVRRVQNHSAHYYETAPLSTHRRFSFHILQAEGYWHQRADERHGNPPPGNQELLVVKDKVGRPQVSLG